MSNAKDFFYENQELFANAQTQPEKYNLYGGLAKLSKDIEDLQRQVRNLESMLGQVLSRL